MPINRAFGDANSEFFAKLSAVWWQWALSIPTSVNPQLDTTGKDAVVGQRGSVWFLAGFFGGGPATRTCSVPQGTALFFPVINSVNINIPDVCGQMGTLTVSQLRALSRLHQWRNQPLGDCRWQGNQKLATRPVGGFCGRAARRQCV
jgi:hypothetical protein